MENGERETENDLKMSVRSGFLLLQSLSPVCESKSGFPCSQKTYSSDESFQKKNGEEKKKQTKKHLFTLC